jgi:molybdate transport system regulatory protein
MSVHAALSLVAENLPPVGRDRIRLLEAIAREGSISAGARAFGLTYKAAWDAVEVMSALFGAPMLRRRTGGRAGGGSEVTEAGLAFIAAFHRIEAELVRAVRAVEDGVALDKAPGFLMRTSARNVLRGTVKAVSPRAIRVEVIVETAPGETIRAVVTRDSVDSLGLCPGRPVAALVKSFFVSVRPSSDPAPAEAALNTLAATVRSVETDGTASEVVLAIGGGRSLTACLPAGSESAPAPRPGEAVLAVFDPADVILAID